MSSRDSLHGLRAHHAIMGTACGKQTQVIKVNKGVIVCDVCAKTIQLQLGRSNLGLIA